MPLNLHGNIEFTPYLKFNAKAGRFYVRFDNGKEDVELKTPIKMAVDFPAIKTGWIKFGQSGPPVKRWDPSLSVESISPDPNDDQYKRGFQVNVFVSSQNVGLREFMSTAGAVCSPLMAMYEEWEARGKPDEVPVYICDGVEEIKGKNGSNYSPMFALDKWVPRNKVPSFDTPVTPRTSGPVPAQRAEPATAQRAEGVSQPPPLADDAYAEDDIPF